MKKSVSLIYAIAAIMVAAIAFNTSAQTRKFRYVNGEWIEVVEYKLPGDTIFEFPNTIDIPVDTVPEIVVLPADTTINVSSRMLPHIAFLPMVFDGYSVRVAPDSIYSNAPLEPDGPLAWVDDQVQVNNRYRRFKQRHMLANPSTVVYNINTLPEAPKVFKTVVDPSTAKITVEEQKINRQDVRNEVAKVEVKKRHWLHNFDGIAQFSQAYVSPNWYQGGRNSLNALISAAWDVKLNPAFHTNILFENSVKYKLGLTDAQKSDSPDAPKRAYDISEDLFQVNTKFGLKAAKRWYYSATLMFRTQLLNNYVPNSDKLKAAFFSPGELNIGLGMTYAYSTSDNKFSINISIAPLSYNLKFCTDNRIPATNFGIEAGKHSVNQYGSNVDANIAWQIAHNIRYTSRLMGFTNYSYIQGDWEHTLSFTINKFLTTQIYVHLRYDTQTKHIEDSKWQKLQCKEILSFGFAYKIGTV